jgi:hypothetical protein
MKSVAILLAFIGFTISAPVGGGEVDPTAAAGLAANIVPGPAKPAVAALTSVAGSLSNGLPSVPSVPSVPGAPSAPTVGN